ncbi:hypothetical protein [Gorillibacterium massiliense]|uniref:hypothetical protein n=1 Tax=Gorillibacterium massiliense TaxID=1280390 RepID=UPI0004B231FD|nr:hypothetical protein [Gorillibacterium massiliense]
MGRHRIRKKRRRRFTKESAVNTALAALTVILILVWAGLYWRNSQDKTLSAPPSSTTAGDTLDTRELLQLGDDTKLPLSSGDSGGEAGAMAGGDTGDAGGSDVGAGATSAPGEAAVETGTTGAGANGAGVHGENASATGAVEATKTPGTAETPNAAGAGHSAGTGSNPQAGAASAAVKTEDYNQEIAKVQTSCMEDTAKIVSGVESSFKQLNRQDPVALKKWNDQVRSEFAAAESACDAAFTKQIALAEGDGVPEKTIKEWKQAYAVAKLKQQQETEDRLVQIVQR